MKKRPTSTQILAVTLFLVACILGALSNRQSQPQLKIPRARYSDATPLGGKGLRLMLERLHYRTRVESGVLSSIPREVKVWLLLDPQTGFSTREAKQLLQWVKDGGTLVWAVSPVRPNAWNREGGDSQPTSTRHLKRELGIGPTYADGNLYKQSTEPLPPLSPLRPGAVSQIWSGVTKAQASKGGVYIERTHLPLARSSGNTQLSQISYGKGHVFITPDALLFTNYALSKPDNAILVSNMVRLHAPGQGLVVFDERQHGDAEQTFEENWLYYLLRPPLRYAVLQLLIAAFVAALLYGRRLGAPVPLPDSGPVTRASQWAQAMGALFQKVGRPHAAGEILGQNFRRQLVRRLGLSITDSDELIARQAAQSGGVSMQAVLQLLQRTKTPGNNEAQILYDAQEMEKILKSLESGEFQF